MLRTKTVYSTWEPGSAAPLSTPGSEESYLALAGPTWRNEFAARTVLEVAFNRPTVHASRLECPLLMQIGTNDRIAPPDAAWSAGAREAFRHLCFSGADAYLQARFETPSLLAGLMWDAGAGGFAVSEPGSALALVWRAAQEMAGLQEAAAIAHPGTLTGSLTRALGMAQLRTETRVTRIFTKSGGVTGVALADGSHIEADHIISTLSRAKTLALAGLPHIVPSVAEAKILLRVAPDFAVPDSPPARHILAAQPGIHADAHEAAVHLEPMAGADRDAVVVEVGARGRRQHDARPVVVGKHHVPLDRTGSDDHTFGAHLPKPLARQLTAGLGYESRQLSNLFEPSSLFWNLASGITQPLFRAGSIDAVVAGAEARKAQATAQYALAVQGAFRDVHDSLNAIASAEALVTTAEKRIVALREVLRLANLRYSNGYSSYLEVLNAQRDLSQAEAGVIDVKRAQLAGVVALYKAMGGGWATPAKS